MFIFPIILRNSETKQSRNDNYGHDNLFAFISFNSIAVAFQPISKIIAQMRILKRKEEIKKERMKKLNGLFFHIYNCRRIERNWHSTDQSLFTAQSRGNAHEKLHNSYNGLSNFTIAGTFQFNSKYVFF